MYVQIQAWNYAIGIVQIDGINPSVLLFILLYSEFPREDQSVSLHNPDIRALTH